MDADSHFYLTLPSNSSLKYYGKQHPSDYTTKLEHSVSLDPSLWEVGLAEISYPKTWDNIPEASLYLAHPPGFSDLMEDWNYVQVRTSFGGRRFRSGKHFVKELNRVIEDNLPTGKKSAIRLRYDDTSGCVKFTILKDFGLWLEKPLAKIIGLDRKMAVELTDLPSKKDGLMVPAFGNQPDDSQQHHIWARHPVNITRFLPTIFLYCDLVQPQFVGDSYVQLLRALTVPDDGANLTYHNHSFTNIHYVNLQTGNFESVHVKLADELGENVPFKHGLVIVKLHFKRKTA